MGEVVFKGSMVELKIGVGAVVLTGAEGLGATVVRLDVGAAVVPLREDVGPMVALELPGTDVGGTLRAVELVGTGKTGVGTGKDVPLVEAVPLAVGRAGLEPLTDAGVGEVVLVGNGVVITVELEGTTTPVAEADVFVGNGRIKVVEFKGRTTLVDGSAGDDKLPVRVGEAAVPLEVGNGAGVLADPGTGPSNVVSFNGTVMVVATAVPLTVTVDTMAVTAAEDVALEVGMGARRVVEFMGMRTLVAATEPLTLTVDWLAVIVELADGGRKGDSGVGLADVVASTVVTTGPEVLLRNGGGTRATSDHG